jgi:hypothetical protein
MSSVITTFTGEGSPTTLGSFSRRFDPLDGHVIFIGRSSPNPSPVKSYRPRKIISRHESSKFIAFHVFRSHVVGVWGSFGGEVKLHILSFYPISHTFPGLILLHPYQLSISIHLLNLSLIISLNAHSVDH